MLDSIKMINEEGTSTPYSLVGGACSVISTTNNGNGSYTLNLPDGVELEKSKIYYVEFSPAVAGATFYVYPNYSTIRMFVWNRNVKSPWFVENPRVRFLVSHIGNICNRYSM